MDDSDSRDMVPLRHNDHSRPQCKMASGTGNNLLCRANSHVADLFAINLAASG
jgi:hypothetical protein